MKKALTADQIAQYNQDGYLILHEFLDSQELEIWRKSVDSAVENRANMKLPDREWVGELKDDEKYYETVFVQRLNLWMDNPAVKELILDPRIGKAAAELAGVEGVRCWHDQALYKPAWGNPTAFHLDVPFWPFTTRSAISIWVALDDVDEQNGCLYFMPGSHLETSFENPGITADMASIFKFYPQLKGREVVPALMKAGDVSFHNGLTVHGAGANMTPRMRRAMTCAFMPEKSTFNGQQNILSNAQFAKLRIGDLLNDDQQNPLLWSNI